jgi:uncharacterized membrane protein
MDSYKILLFLHLAGVIVGLGATFSFPFIQAAAERQGTGATRFALRVMHRVERFLVIPGAVIVLLAGIGLIFDDRTGYSDDFPAWLMVAIAWFAVAFFTGGYIQGKNVEAALRALDRVSDNAALPAAYQPIGKRMQMIGGLLGLSVIGIALLMVWKPGQ